MSQATYKAGQVPAGYQQLTVSTVVLRLTVPAGTVRAVIGIEAQPIRYRVDGNVPSSSVGFLVKADQTIEIEGNLAVKAFRVIRQSSTDAVLNVIYYKDLGTVTMVSISSPSASASPSSSVSPSPSA
jgi:hypothetical protein